MTQMNSVDSGPDGMDDLLAESQDSLLAYIQDKPLTSVILAFFAGLIVGRLVL